ncbi:MAG: anti-sigma factor [Burkholderiaceae bacterium]|nr:anti-sigma factor [Burkholderiaceae bacterium]
MTPDDREERIASAGEYVLGTLSPADRDAFEQALAGNTALQAEVYYWQDRLLPLAERVRAEPPAAQLWPDIEARLGTVPIATSAPSSTVLAANDPMWQRLRRWRVVSGMAIAASVLLASLLVLRAPGPPAAPADRYLALLQSPDKSTGWVVEVTAGDKVRLVPVGATAEVPAGKALQFWTKAEGAAGPTSLGLIRPGQVTELPAARLPAVGERTLFELTLEPETGSPIGRPTGPVLFIGRTVRL